MISVFIFTSNDFQPWKIEEREREKEQEDRLVRARIQPDRIGARRSHHFDHSNPPSSNLVIDHRDRLAISEPRAKRETERVERLSHREPTRTDEPTRTANPLASTNPGEPTRTNKPTHTNSFSFSFEIFVIKFVCDFDFLLSLFDL